MRKFVLAIAALLGLSSAAWAAFGIFTTYIPPVVPQLTCNLSTGVASANSPCVSPVAACNGDVQTVTRTATITSGAGGNKYLNTSVNTFTNTATDAGKVIRIPGVTYFGGGQAYTTIASVTDAQNVVLTDAASSTLAPTSKNVTFGTDDAPKFMAFNSWARTNQGTSQIVLNGASGANCWFGTSQINSGVLPNNLTTYWVAGIKNLLVDWPGATWSSANGSDFQLGAAAPCERGLADASGCSARINTANPSDSTVTLTAASAAAGYISRFPVNQWIVIGALNTQATTTVANNGQPQNMYFYEFRQVTANNGTNVLTLDRPLTKTFLSTYPEYNTGDSSHADPGGPATIWAMAGTLPEIWGYTVEIKGAVGNPITIIQSGQVYMGIRNFTMRNIAFSGGGGAIPSVNENWSAYNVDYTGLTVEVDKLIGTVTIDGMTISQLKFQSASPDTFIGRNLTVSNNITGGGKVNQIYDSTIATWSPGSYVHGESTSNECTRCNVTTFNPGAGAQNGAFSHFSMSGGVISLVNSDNTGINDLSRIFIAPKGNYYYAVGSGGFGDTIGLFNLSSITQDPTNTFFQTNEAGGFPTWTTTSFVGFRAHPSPQFTCDACTGDIALQATNIQNGATALAPLGNYSSYTYTPTTSGFLSNSFAAYGKLQSATINVSTAFNGAGSATLSIAGQFGTNTAKQSDWSQYGWNPIINLKQAGIRVISPNSVTCDTGGGPVAGACSGDTINNPGNGVPTEAVWLRGFFRPYMNQTLTCGGGSGFNCPVATITLRTDQGVVP